MFDMEIFRVPAYKAVTINETEFQLSNYPYLDVVMTDRCNSKCKFCIGDLLHKKLDGDLNTFKAQIGYAVKELGVREVLLLGGEPTIAPMLFPLLDWMESTLVSTGLLNKVCLTTNGKKLKDAAFRQRLLQSAVTHLNISIMSLDAEHQNFIHGSRSNVDIVDLAAIYSDCKKTGVNLRVNSNVYKTNHDTVESMTQFVQLIQDHCDSIKFSPLLKTDSFSVVPEVNEFNKEYLLDPVDYDELFASAEKSLLQNGGILVRNPNTFGFVEYSMIGPANSLKVPVIMNYNHRGRMLHQATVHNQINNIKLLPNGNLSRSWNREELSHVIRFAV